MKGILKHAVCSLCTQLFSVRDLGSRHGGQRIPHVLNCGHAACRPCLQSFMADKKNRGVICKVCDTPSPFLSNGDLMKMFPIHLYLVGHFLTRNAVKKEEEPTFSYPAIRKAAPRRNKVLCKECDSASGDCFCRECAEPYCNSCFEKVHQAKTLKRHVKEDIRLAQLRSVLMCPKHPKTDLDMLCETCNVPVCMKCSILSHKDHSVVSTCEKNEEKLPEVKADLERAALQRARIKETLKETRELCAGGGAGGADRAADALLVAERALAASMVHVHGRLQLREMELLDEIEQRRSENEAHLRSLESELATSLADLEDAMRTAHAASLPDNMPTSNLTEVHTRLCRAMAAPCHLLQVSGDVGLMLSEEIYNNIEGVVKLELESDTGYRLLKDDELPSGYVLSDLSEKSLNDFDPWGQDSVSDAGNVSMDSFQASVSASFSHKSISSSSSTISTMSSCSVLIPAGKPISNSKKFMVDPREGLVVGGKPVHVKISHVTSPLDFYVILKSHDEILQQLSEEIQRESYQCVQPKNVQRNQLCMFKDTYNSIWCRVRVISVKANKVEIFCVDYGGTYTMDMSRLKELPRKFTSLPDQAVRCGLYGMHVIEAGNWKESAFTEILEKIDGKFIRMSVFGVNEDKYEVDLISQESNISSVRDTLLYFGEGSLLSNERPLWVKNSQSCKPYPPGRKLKQNSNFSICITEVDSPCTFKCFLLDDVSCVQGLNAKIKIYIENNKSKLGNFYRCVGMPCLAPFQGEWYRGKIKEISSLRSVLVHFVDFGNYAEVPGEEVTSIPDELLEVPELSINCTLTGIAPIKGANVTQEVKDLIILLGERNSVIHVTGVNDENYQVILVSAPPDLYTSINVNELLVEKRLMTCNGPRSVFSMDNASAMEVSKLLGLSDAETSFEDLQGETIQHQNKHFPASGGVECVSTCEKSDMRLINQKTSESDLTSQEEVSDSEDEKQLCSDASSLPYPNSISKPEVSSDMKGLTSVVNGLNATSPTDKDQNLVKSVQSRLNNTNCSTGPIRVPVEVMTAISPACIFVRVKNITDKIERLSQEMQFYYGSNPDEEEDCWKPAVRSRCAVKSLEDFQWHRGLILEVLSSSEYKVMLKDIGRTEVVGQQNLRKLFPKFASVPDGSVKCHLANLKIAGPQPSDNLTKQMWSAFACEELNKLLKEYKLNLFISKKGQIDQEERSLPIELWVRDTVSSALEASKVVWFTINKKLVDLGCALPVDWKLMSEEDMLEDMFLTNNYLELINPVDDPDHTMMEWLEKTDQDSSCSSDDSDIVENLKSLGSWLPPSPLPETAFQAMPTYVDYDCNIYLHDLSRSPGGSLRVLHKVDKALHKKFNESKPAPEDSFWLPNNLCIVQYHLDKKWYRGKVLKVKPDNKIKVRFADYGNVETCRSSDLRKNIICRKLPSVARKCRIPGLTPISKNGKWPIPTLDFIHGTIVEKECTVKVIRKPTPEDDVYEVDIRINNRNLIEILLEKEFATYMPINTTAIPEEQSDDDDRDVLLLEESDHNSTNLGPTNVESSAHISVSSAPLLGEEKEFSKPVNHNTLNLKKTSSSSDTGLVGGSSESITVPLGLPLGRGKNFPRHFNQETLQQIVSGCNSDNRDLGNGKNTELISASFVQVLGRGKKILKHNAQDTIKRKESSCNPDEVLSKQANIMEVISASSVPSSGGGQRFSKHDTNDILKQKESGHYTDRVHSLKCNSSIPPIGRGKKLSACVQAQPSSSLIYFPYTPICKADKTSLVTQFYPPPVLPESSEWTVSVQYVLGPVNVVIFIKEVPDKQQWNCWNSYQSMYEEMQVESAFQSPVTNISYGLPCCALSGGGLWYRGIVTEIKKTDICVKNVDSGEEESVPTVNIRTIPSKWLKHPVFGIECKLNCALVPDKNVKMICKRMLKLIMNKTLMAVVKRREPLTVDLFSSKTKERLVYQELIEDGLLEEKCDK